MGIINPAISTARGKLTGKPFMNMGDQQAIGNPQQVFKTVLKSISRKEFPGR